jgi:hypothetical protein
MARSKAKVFVDRTRNRELPKLKKWATHNGVHRPDPYATTVAETPKLVLVTNSYRVIKRTQTGP